MTSQLPTQGLCLFDLDDTLLPLDSDHAWGEFLVTMGWVEPVEFKRQNNAFYAQYQMGTLDIHAYIDFVTQPLRSRTEAQLASARSRFMQDVMAPHIRPAAKHLVQAHQARGDRVALVTATNDFVTEPIAQALDIDTLLAVRLERGPSGTITGRIHGTPSFREGKVVRVQEWLATQGCSWADFKRISVYSDSLNDLALLERATEPIATNPTPALEALAVKRNWRILKLFE
jgi:HAD superfamily hydrolase (TIGR01490 family)